MKTLNITVATIMLVSFSYSQEETEVNIGLDSTVTTEETLKLDKTLKIFNDNQGLLFPALGYWGVDNFLWETTNLEMVKTFDKVEFQESFDGSQIIKQRYFEHDFKVHLNYDQDSKLNEVVYSYSSSDRAKLLKLYKELRDSANEKYSAPTHIISPQQAVSGKDVYLNNQCEKYHLEWHGIETSVALILTKLEVSLIYKPSETSNASALNEILKD